MKWHARANGAIVATFWPKPQNSYWDMNDDASWIVLNAPSREEAEAILNRTRIGLVCNQIDEVFRKVPNG